jgi:hypothetical protein
MHFRVQFISFDELSQKLMRQGEQEQGLMVF